MALCSSVADIILHNLDAILADRSRRVAETRGWSLQRTALHLIESGLFAVEAEMVGRFSDHDASASTDTKADDREQTTAREHAPTDSPHPHQGQT